MILFFFSLQAISISPTARQFTSVGEIVNLMSVDCQRVQDGFQNSFNIVSFFFMVTIATYQMWTLMGISAMGTLGFIVTFAPVGATLAATQNSLQQKILKLKGTRMKVLHEVIAGIKVRWYLLSDYKIVSNDKASLTLGSQ